MQAQQRDAPPGGAPASPTPSWVADLEAYLGSNPGAPCADPAARRDAVAALKAAPASPDAWLAFLSAEESGGGGLTGAICGGGTAQLAGAGGISLYHLYFWATQLVPRAKNQHRDEYVRLWLGYARQQWARSPDDARDTFKTLRNSSIGAASAALYSEWAGLEYAAGNVSRALGILAKGFKEGAQPTSTLERLKAEMQSGTFDLKQQQFTETITVRFGSQSQPGAAVHAHGGAHPATTPAPPPRWPAGAPLSAAPLSAAPPSAAPFSAVATGAGGAGAAASAVRRGAGDVPPWTLGLDASLAATPAPRAAPAISGAVSVVSCAAASSAPAPSATSQGIGGGGGGNLTVHSGSTRSTLSGASLALGSAGRSSHRAGDGPLCSAAAGERSSGSSGGERGGGGGSRGAAAAAAEEDTISCGAEGRRVQEAAAPAPASARAAACPSAAHPALSATAAPGHATGANTTGTIGMKRFGFKSRALRIGGSAEPPAPHEAQHRASAEQQRASEAQAAAEPAAPRLPAAAALATAAAAAASLDRGSGEDSPPLLMGRLAAKLVPGRGTPSHGARRTSGEGDGANRLATPEDCAAAAAGPGVICSQRSTPPEGCLPSSLDTTPIGAIPGVPTPPAAAGASERGRGEMDAHQPGCKAPAAAAPAGASAAPPAAAMPPPRAADAAEAAQRQQARQPLRPVLQPVDPAAAAERQQRPSGDAAKTQPKPAQPLPAAAGAGHQQQQEQRPPPAAVAPLQPPVQQRQSLQAQQAAQQQAPAPPRPQPQQVPPSQQGQPRQPQQQQQQRQPQPPAQQQPQQQQGQQQQVQQQQPQQQGQQPAAPAPAPAPAAAVQRRAREDAHTVYVQGVRYTKLECVGRGGSSKVFKVMGPNCRIFALKRIRLQGRDAEAAAGFVDEINLLHSLKGRPNIIQLIDAQVFTEEGLVYMVQEYGEIDLARLLAKHEATRRQASGAAPSSGAAPAAGAGIDENFIRLYWQQMLQAVAIVHEMRIVHSDLKPANYLLVEGQLKLIDFGIAKAIGGDTTSIARESQVGTLNYMSPEAILGGSNNILGAEPMKVGRPSDIWSLGCILYQMVFGRTPFADLPFIPKMHAICDPRHAIQYPPCSNPDVVDVIRRCLDRDPRTRITMQELLDHPFLHPNRPRAAPPAALSTDHIRALLEQAAKAGASGSVDIEALTRQLMGQLGTAAGGGSGGGGS
ncbi:serine threonine kinase family [Raphidocelis subcapitata]|uniref:Serine threonine kinase family n=1 Tax=Raphidocelis subcapitata TaxID=307507 RepID=A0A2V0NNQ3_9CHLO|nr:serine threonine kinase family [Raphidocelis subcapitata]|eukprot:GBF89221.1 serine threonine kinase family [Raphidocelis subcapitata]